jgi:hypothetical protein
MTTPLDIISGALLDIGAREAGETVGPDDANEAFTLLNMMLDQWSNEDFMIISINEIVKNIAGGGTDWTIGPSGMINAVRPLSINSAFVRVATIDYPVAVINVEQYELIGIKQLAGPWPRALWYNSGTPLGTIKFWPNPSSGEIHLFCNQLFTQFTGLTDTLQFTQGYELAFRSNLACLLMPSYGKASTTQIAMIQAIAKSSKANIKSTNMLPPQTAQFDSAIVRGSKTNAAWVMNGGFF